MDGTKDGKRIASARVLIIGAGLLGSVTAEALIARGVRHFVIFDPSSVGFRDVDGEHFVQSDVGSRYAAEVTAARLVPMGASCTYQVAGAQKIDGWNFEAVLCCNASYGDRMTANMRVRQYHLALVDGIVSGRRARVQTVLSTGPCLGCLVTSRSSVDPGIADPVTLKETAEFMAEEAVKIIAGRMYDCVSGVIHMEDGNRVVLNTGISPSCPFHRDGKWQNTP